eukprot:2241183-Prymnesium_polylepis.1
MLREHGEATCNHSDRLLATLTSPPRSVRRQTVTPAGAEFLTFDRGNFSAVDSIDIFMCSGKGRW